MRKKYFSIVLAIITVITCMMFVSCYDEKGAKKYTVVFDSNGGSQVASITVEKNKYAQEPTAPTKADDTFLYWYLSSKTIEFDFENYAITKNITLKARWESDVEKYTITFDSAGGSQVASQEVEDYKYVQRPQDPTKEGDTFYYWYLDTQNHSFDFEGTKVKNSITLKARWESDPTLYTIFYKIGNEIYDMEEIGRSGYYATKPTNPTKDNSAFVYWCLEGTNEPFDFSTTEITQNITLKAKFLTDSITDGQIKFYLGSQAGKFEVDGINSSQQKISANVGDVISLPRLTAPYNDFLGWVNATTGEKYLIAEYPNLSDYKFTYDGSPLVMYAIWE